MDSNADSATHCHESASHIHALTLHSLRNGSSTRVRKKPRANAASPITCTARIQVNRASWRHWLLLVLLAAVAALLSAASLACCLMLAAARERIILAVNDTVEDLVCAEGVIWFLFCACGLVCMYVGTRAHTCQHQHGRGCGTALSM